MVHAQHSRGVVATKFPDRGSRAASLVAFSVQDPWPLAALPVVVVYGKKLFRPWKATIYIYTLLPSDHLGVTMLPTIMVVTLWQ